MKPAAPLWISLLLPLASSLSAAPESADFVPTDGSSYEVGAGTLIGQGPPIQGFLGNWLEAFGGVESPGVIANGLSFPGTISSGGAFNYPGAGGGRTGRLLPQDFGDFAESTVYFSVLIQLEVTGGGYRAFELHSAGFVDDTNRTLQIATGEEGTGPFNTSNFVVRIKDGLNVDSADLGPGDTDVNLFVGKAELSRGFSSDTLTIWRNPNPLAEPALGDAVFAGVNFRFDRISLARFGSDGITFDEIRFGPTYADVTSFDHVAAADSDNDGMRDEWELEFFLVVGTDDSAGNPDGDGLSNLEEFQNGSDPGLTDTDRDGIDDGVEVANGTDPNKADTDGDGIDDLEESVPGADGFITDPLNPDTDNDGESDQFEIARGTDPTDPNSNTASRGVVLIDGMRDALYGEPLAVQNIQTGFGNNQSEWNAAYGIILNGRLDLLFTGNLEANFNKLEVFIDAGAGGVSVFPALPGNDGSGAMTGMRFDAAFTPEFHLIARRGLGKFDLDISRLGTSRFSFYENVFGFGEEGSGTTGTGLVNLSAMEVAYDDSNRAGVGGSGGNAADQAAARAVTTGFELRIALTDLGNPAEVRVMLLQNGNTHGFLSNQSLGGLPVGTGNLGNPGAIDFNNLAGDQFFTVSLSPLRLELEVTGMGDRNLNATVDNIPPGQTFHVRGSLDGQTFTPLAPALDFTAATPQPLQITGTAPTMFIQVFEGPSSP